MGVPGETSVGEKLKSSWLNVLREEVKANTIVSSSGLTFNRSTGGTTLNIKGSGSARAFNGQLVTVINNDFIEYQQWWFAGVEVVTDRDNMQGNISRGVDYVLRAPRHEDIFGRLVMLAEPIGYNGVGQAYISSDMMICRVRFAADGSEDEYRFATIADLDEAGGEESAHILKSTDAMGPVQVIDVEPDTTDHPEEPDWRWAIIKFGYDIMVPKFAEATSDPIDGKLTVRLATSDGTMVGRDLVVYDGGM